MALLIFKACGGDVVVDMVDVAVALELIHSATLLHDDIIDGGKTRRGRPSAFSQYGLATRSSPRLPLQQGLRACGRFEEHIVRWAADACISLTKARSCKAASAQPERHRRRLLEIIARKTASLFSQGARVAAHLAGA